MRFLFLLFVSIVSTAISVSAQGISMSPTRLFFTGNPGETVTETLILHNGSGNDYIFEINYKDWKREADGTKIYFKSDSLKTSNASWISTMENIVNIPAGTNKEVLVTMQIPENASSSSVTNSMLFFTQLSKQADKAPTQLGIGIITLFEFGLHIYYTPTSNTIKSLDITNIEEIVNDDTTMRKVAVSITNDGNTVNDATVEFELINTDSGEEIKFKSKSISMTPQTNQVVEFILPDDISGNYMGVSIIKMAGSKDLRVGEKNFAF